MKKLLIVVVALVVAGLVWAGVIGGSSISGGGGQSSGQWELGGAALICDSDGTYSCQASTDELFLCSGDGTAQLESEAAGSATNTIAYPLVATHNSSSQTTGSFGTGIYLDAEDASGTQAHAASLKTWWTTATGGAAESSACVSTYDQGGGDLACAETWDKDGNSTLAGGQTVAAASEIEWTGRESMTSPADEGFVLKNAAGTKGLYVSVSGDGVASFWNGAGVSTAALQFGTWTLYGGNTIVTSGANGQLYWYNPTGPVGLGFTAVSDGVYNVVPISGGGKGRLNLDAIALDDVSGSVNHALCAKANGLIGYCSAVVDANGECGTCN